MVIFFIKEFVFESKVDFTFLLKKLKCINDRHSMGTIQMVFDLYYSMCIGTLACSIYLYTYIYIMEGFEYGGAITAPCSDEGIIQLTIKKKVSF